MTHKIKQRLQILSCGLGPTKWCIDNNFMPCGSGDVEFWGKNFIQNLKKKWQGKQICVNLEFGSKRWITRIKKTTMIKFKFNA